MRSCLLLLMLSVGLTGCADSNEPGTPSPLTSSTQSQNNKGTIGYSTLTLKNPFFKIIADSLTEEAGKHGFQVVVNDAADDVSTQSKHIDNYIVQNVTAIVLNPADRIAIGPAIKKANDAGIPVFTCDLQCVADGVKIAGHVGTDNYQGGRLGGQAMIEVLGERGGQVLVLHFKQANSCVLRVQGFSEVLDEYNQDRQSGRIEIVAELDGGGSRDKGFKATADALQAYPDLSGIFAINDPSALGAWTALKQASKDDQIRIIGFDGELAGKRAIQEGKIYADPIQFPEKMGTVTMQNILKYLEGEKFERVQLFPTKLYKKADADQDPDLQKGPSTGSEN